MRYVRVQGIREFKDRHGKMRRYYRRKGAPNIPIPPDLKGVALIAEIARLDAMYLPLKPKSGTLRLLIEDYKKSSNHWNNVLGDRTRKDYDRVFNWLGASQDKPIIGFTTPVIAKLRDKANAQSGFKLANQLVISLGKVLAYGVEQGDVDKNTAIPVGNISRPKDLPAANRPWGPQEAVTLLRALPIHLRAPIALAAFLGLREGDLCKVPLSAYRDGLIQFTASKNKRVLELPVVDDLAGVLGEYLNWRSKMYVKRKRPDLCLTLFVNSRLRPWTEDGLKTSFGKARDELVHKGTLAPGITVHGARHTVAGILADAGFEKEDRRHILGHGGEDISDFYARRAKRRSRTLEMAESIEKAYREAGWNVVDLEQRRTKSVKPIG